MLWITPSLLAGLFQAFRTALQQHLRSSLSVSGAGFVRYGWGLPFAILLAWGFLTALRQPLPLLPPRYLLLAAIAGIAQIFGTSLLIMAFGHRGFVVGTAFSKTEPLQAALVAAVLAGERLSSLAWSGIALGLAGVLVLALAAHDLRRSDILAAMTQPAALCGLGAAALFAATGLLVKQATASLPAIDPVGAALVTLVVVMAFQAGLHGAWIALREPATLVAVVRTWKVSALVGLMSACGSACWFTAFALAPVALVRIVGQSEVLFTMLFARGLLKERIRVHQVVGLLLVAAGVVLSLIGQI